jgi:hypothetical protein
MRLAGILRLSESEGLTIFRAMRTDQERDKVASRTRIGRATPCGLVGMLAIVLVVETCVERHRDEFASPVGAMFEATGRASRSEVLGRDVLFFGDSVVKFGVAPRVIEGRTGFRGYNLATIGSPAEVPPILLRRALETGARPKAVFVDFKPTLLGGHGADPPSLGRIAGLGDGLRLAWAARQPDDFARFATGWLLPTYRDRFMIRTRINEALSGQHDPSLRLPESRRRNWEINLGAEVLPPNPASLSTPEFANERKNLDPAWSCDPVNLAVIEDFFELAEAHQIPVFWLLTPVHPRVQAGRERLGIDLSWDRFLVERTRGRDVVVVDARRLGVDPDLFVDATHLDRRGAMALSEALADFLGEWQRGSTRSADRWVVLPPRKRSLDDGRLIEDTDQTSLTLRRDGASRRR